MEQPLLVHSEPANAATTTNFSREQHHQDHYTQKPTSPHSPQSEGKGGDASGGRQQGGHATKATTPKKAGGGSSSDDGTLNGSFSVKLQRSISSFQQSLSPAVLPPFVDFIQGNVRSPALLFLSFFFLIGAACLFFVMIFSTTEPHGYVLRFLENPPQNATLGAPLPPFSVVAVRPDEAAYSGAWIRARLRPAKPFPVMVDYGYPHTVMASRTIDCQLNDFVRNIPHAFGQIDDTLCQPEDADGVDGDLVQANELGKAVFDNLRLKAGHSGPWVITIDVVDGPGEAGDTAWVADAAHSDVENDNSISADISFSILRPEVKVDGYTLFGRRSADDFPYGVLKRPVELTGTVAFDAPAGFSVGDFRHTVHIISPPAPLYFGLSFPVNLETQSQDAFCASLIDPETNEAHVENFACVPSNNSMTGTRCTGNFTARPVVLGSTREYVSFAAYFGGATSSFRFTKFTRYDSTYLPTTGFGATLSLDNGTSHIVRSNGPIPANVTETRPLSISVRVWNGTSGVPLEGVVVFFSATYDPTARESLWNEHAAFRSKFLAANMSSATDKDGNASMTTYFSSLGEPGRYDLWAHFGSAHVKIGSIVVLTRVARLCAHDPYEEPPSEHCTKLSVRIPNTGILTTDKALLNYPLPTKSFMVMSGSGAAIPAKNLAFDLLEPTLDVRFFVEAAPTDRQGHSLIGYIGYFIPSNSTRSTWVRVTSDGVLVGWLQLNATFSAFGPDGTSNHCYPPVVTPKVPAAILPNGRPVWLTSNLTIAGDTFEDYFRGVPATCTVDPVVIGHQFGWIEVDRDETFTTYLGKAEFPVPIPQDMTMNVLTMRCFQPPGYVSGACKDMQVPYIVSFAYMPPFSSVGATVTFYQEETTLSYTSNAYLVNWTDVPILPGFNVGYLPALTSGFYSMGSIYLISACKYTNFSDARQGTLNCWPFVPLYRTPGFALQIQGNLYMTSDTFFGIPGTLQCAGVAYPDVSIVENIHPDSDAFGFNITMTFKHTPYCGPAAMRGVWLYFVLVTRAFLDTLPAGVTFDDLVEYDCWTNTSALLNDLPCLILNSGRLVAPTTSVDEDGVAFISVWDVTQSLDLDLVILWSAPEMALTGQIDAEHTSPGSFTFDQESISLADDPPASVEANQRFGFVLNTESKIWGMIGMIAYVRFYIQDTKIEVPYNVDVDSLTTPAFNTPGYYYSRGNVLTVEGLWFPSTTPPGPVDVYVGLSGGRGEGVGSNDETKIATMEVGAQACVASLTNAGVPVSMEVGQTVPIGILVTCGGTPAQGIGVKASISSTNADCVGTECGYLRAAGTFGITGSNGRTMLDIVVTSISPKSNFYILINTANFDVDGANVNVAAVEGVGVPRSNVMGVIDRVFQLATASLTWSNAQTVRLGPIRPITHVGAVTILEQPEVECTLSGGKPTSACTAMDKPVVVKVTDSQGRPMASEFVTFLIFKEENMRAPTSEFVVDCRPTSCAVGVITNGEGEAKFKGFQFVGSEEGEYFMKFYSQGTASEASSSIKAEAENSDVEEMKENAELASFLLLIAMLPVLVANTSHRSNVFVFPALFLAIGFILFVFIDGLHWPLVQAQPLLQLHILLLTAAAILATAMLGFIAVVNRRKMNWPRVYQIVEGEGRLLRCYRYTHYLLNHEDPSDQEVLNESIEEQEESFRKRHTKSLAHKFEHSCPSETLAENLSEIVEGEWEPLSVMDVPRVPRPLPDEYKHLDPEVPSRFLIVIAFSISITVIMVYLSLYIVDGLANFAASAAVYLPSSRPLDAESNAILQETLVDSVQMVGKLIPDSRFQALAGFKPLVEHLNFVEIVNALATFLKNVAPIVRPLGITASVTGGLTVLLTLVLVTSELRVLQRHVRQGTSKFEGAELEEADEYVGVHVLGIVLTFFMGFFFVLIVYGSALLIYHNFFFLWDQLRNIVISVGALAVFELIAGKFVALMCHKGIYFTAPRLYMLWSAIAGVLSLFGAVPVIIKRFVQALLSMIFLFARFDLKLFPESILTEDLGHSRLMSLVIVDHHHNNAIMLTFVGMLLFRHEMRLLIEAGGFPVKIRECGRRAPFPQVRAMIRVIAAVECGATNGSHKAPRSIPVVWQRTLLSFFCPYTDIVENVDVAFDPDEVHGTVDVDKRRIMNKWHLAMLLVRNPSLCKYRKHAMPKLKGYHYAPDEEEEEHEGSGSEGDVKKEKTKKGHEASHHGGAKKKHEESSSHASNGHGTASRAAQRHGDPEGEGDEQMHELGAPLLTAPSVHQPAASSHDVKTRPHQPSPTDGAKTNPHAVQQHHEDTNGSGEPQQRHRHDIPDDQHHHAAPTAAAAAAPKTSEEEKPHHRNAPLLDVASPPPPQSTERHADPSEKQLLY